MKNLGFLTLLSIVVCSGFTCVAGQSDSLPDRTLQRLLQWKRNSRALLRSDTALAFGLARSFADSTQTESSLLYGEAMQNIGIMRMMTEEHKKAIPALRKAMKNFRKLNDSARTGYAYRNMGLAHSRLARPDSALNNYYLSLTYLDSLQSPYFYALSASGLARTLFSLNTYEYSAMYYRRAIRLFILDGRLGEAAQSLHELAYLLVRQGDAAYAPYSDRALRLAVQEGDSALVGQIESVKARYLLDLARAEEAWPHLQRTQRIYRDIYDAYFLLAVDQLIAEYYLQKDELELAEFRASEALKALNARVEVRYDEKFLREQLYKTLFTVYYRMGDFSQAIAFARAYKETAEQLLEQSQTNRLHFMEREIASIQRQQELERTKLQLAFAEQNRLLLERQRLAFAIAAILLLALLITAFLAYQRIRRSREELAKQKAFIEEQHKELEVLNANKDQLFAIIGHDLRGPVGNLSNLLTFLPAEEDTIGADSQEILDTAQQGLIESLDLLENLLIWAKEQKEDFQLKVERQEIMPYIEQIEQLYAPLIRQRNIKFDYAIPQGTTACFDKNTFKTVVRNIVSNGIKYIPEGSTIRYDSRPVDGMLELVIEDNGKGIPKEIIQALSEDEGDHRMLKKKNKGDLGLGLRMSRDFVRANGGEMIIEAHGPLGGACFTISLPIDC